MATKTKKKKKKEEWKPAPGQKVRKLSSLPRLPSAIDKLPAPISLRGRRMRWVGIGWVDEGEADGTEPLFVEDDE